MGSKLAVLCKMGHVGPTQTRNFSPPAQTLSKLTIIKKIT